MDAGISFDELLEYAEGESRRWKAWFREHPEVLDAPCEIVGAGTVRKLLLHVFVPESFFGHRLTGRAWGDWQQFPASTVDDLFAVGEEARRMMREFLAQATAEDWHRVEPLGFGELRASPRKMMAQALLHGVHHRGQLAAFLRQQGYDAIGRHDLILTDVMD